MYYIIFRTSRMRSGCSSWRTVSMLHSCNQRSSLCDQQCWWCRSGHKSNWKNLTGRMAKERCSNVSNFCWTQRFRITCFSMIREAALNASCTHICHTLLPRAYCAVVLFFSSDLQRRSRCTDIIVSLLKLLCWFYFSDWPVHWQGNNVRNWASCQ